MNGIVTHLTNPWWALAATIAIALTALAVFLHRNPVDGDLRIIAAFDNYSYIAAIAVGIMAYGLSPTPWVLAPLLGMCLWAVHYKHPDLDFAY